MLAIFFHRIKYDFECTEIRHWQFSHFHLYVTLKINVRCKALTQVKCFGEHVSTIQPYDNYNKPVKIFWGKKEQEIKSVKIKISIETRWYRPVNPNWVVKARGP